MVRYAIVFVPEGPLSSKINRLRTTVAKKFDTPRVLRAPVHLTLFYPFETRRIVTVERVVKECVASERAFDLKLNGLGHFGKEVWFVKVAKKSLLVRLQRKLKSSMHKLKHILPEPAHTKFNPHITLAYHNLTPTKFEKIRMYLANKSMEGDVRFGSITILRDTGKKMVIHKRFKLKP